MRAAESFKAEGAALFAAGSYFGAYEVAKGYGLRQWMEGVWWCVGMNVGGSGAYIVFEAGGVCAHGGKGKRMVVKGGGSRAYRTHTPHTQT